MKIDLDFTNEEIALLQMSVMVFKVDLERNDPDKLSIPGREIDVLWEKVQTIKRDFNL